MNTSTKAAASLEERIRAWIEENPARTNTGQRMLAQLQRIQTEFTGETARRLEALVGEAFERQLQIDASRRAGEIAAKRLSETVQELTRSLHACLLSANHAHQVALVAALSAAQAQRRALGLVGRRDRMLLN